MRSQIGLQPALEEWFDRETSRLMREMDAGKKMRLGALPKSIEAL